MKIKKILTTFLVSVVAVSAMVFPASAESEMNAYIYIGDTEWACQYWGESNTDNTLTDSLITASKITGDGSYSVAIDVSKGYRGNETDFTVIQDICVLGVEIGGNSGKDYPNAKIIIDNIMIDGEKAIFKDIPTTINEDDSTDKKLRADIYNAYGTKALENVVDYKNFSKIEISFTVSGMGTLNTENPLETSSTTIPDTTTTPAPTTSEKITTTTSVKEEATTPSTGNAGIIGLVLLAGLCTLIAGCTRKK